MAYQSGLETNSQQQRQRQNSGLNPSLYELNMPPGSSESWKMRLENNSSRLSTGFAVGTAIAVGATSIAKAAEKEAQEAETKKRAELEKKQREEEWARTNGRERNPDEIAQERGRRGETKAETAVAQEDAKKRIANVGNSPGASLAERQYAKMYGSPRDEKDKDSDKFS